MSFATNKRAVLSIAAVALGLAFARPLATAALAAGGPQAGPPAQTPGSGEAARAQKERKRRATQIMLYVVVGIAAGGVFLIVLVMLGGHRVRQLARRPIRRSESPEPFWYLKGRREQPAPGDDDADERE